MNRILGATIAAAMAAMTALMSSGAMADPARVGTFEGASDHVTSGAVSVVNTIKGGSVVILDSDFSLDGAPDPRVGLGRSGKYDKATDLGKLQKIKGLQAYIVPAGVNVAEYDEVYIWCRKFNVPLGVAALK